LLSFGSAQRLRGQLPDQRDRLYRVAFSWCHDPVLADDLVQETLVKALAKIHGLRDRERLGSWLFRILSNCWKDHLRTRREMLDIDDIVLASPHMPADSYREQELVGRVRAGVALLPSGQRQVLTLVDLEGMSYSEVAEVLEIPIGTVMSRLSRARAALGERLRSYGATLVDPPQATRLRSIK
jgi:RNA polymerase sigma-70 factor (ECF subfamily)